MSTVMRAWRGLFTEQDSVVLPAGLLVAARLANMAISLAMIPVLIHYLGGEGFSAWALLLAASVAFSAFEIGMAPTYVKHVAPLIQAGAWREVGAELQRVVALLTLSYGLAALPAIALTAWAGQRLHVPDGAWLSVPQMAVLIFVAAFLRAVLQLGAMTFNAARRFRALALFSFLQSFLSNVAATAAAAVSHRVDVSLVFYWLGQFAALAAGVAAARELFGDAWRWVRPRADELRRMAGHGLKIQVADWAQIVNFQYDKFLVAGSLGLSSVAAYEVANRCALALRSIPCSGIESFLASAAIGRGAGTDSWPRYQQVTRLAVIGLALFLLAPLAVAPSFLFGWTGELGYSARWILLFLILGAGAGVVVLPAALMAQAAGRADLQARAAVVSMAINLPLSFALVHGWQSAGAAAGTAVAMTAGAVHLLWGVHRAYGQPLRGTWQVLRPYWPLPLICLAYGIGVFALFEHWLTGLPPNVRYAFTTRVWLGLATGVAYAGCLGLMAAVQAARGVLTRAHLQAARDWLRQRMA